jgi:hypothetical protein
MGRGEAVDITITGTRATEGHDGPYYGRLFDLYLAPFVKAGHGFLVGGAIGVDTLALTWLASHRAPVTVVVPGTVAEQPDAAQDAVRQAQREGLVGVVELRHPGFPQAEAYHARNRWMVYRSQFTIGFPRTGEDGSGTWYTLDYAAGKGLPRLIVPV